MGKKRTLHLSNSLENYIKEQIANGITPSVAINELYEKYIEIIKAYNSKQVLDELN